MKTMQKLPCKWERLVLEDEASHSAFRSVEKECQPLLDKQLMKAKTTKSDILGDH